MKETTENIFNIDFAEPESTDSIFEEVKIYDALESSAEKLNPSRLKGIDKEAFYFALRIIARHFANRDNCGKIGIDHVSDLLENKLRSIGNSHFNTLSEYFNIHQKAKLFYELNPLPMKEEKRSLDDFSNGIGKEKKMDEIVYQLEFEFVLSSITNIVELHLERLKVFFKFSEQKQYWYNLIPDEENEDQEEARNQIDIMVEEAFV